MRRTMMMILAAVSLAGCKGNFSPNEENSQNPFDYEFSGGRRLSISGRAMGQAGSDGDARVSLAGASVLAVVNGVTYAATSRENGEWVIRDVPLRPSRDAQDTDDLPTVVIYFEKLGWTFDGDSVTAGVQNWIQVRVDTHQADATGNFHVDLGPLIFDQDALKVSSSLLKPNTALTSRWLTAGSWVGSTDAERREVYMYEGDTSITLHFNMPIDTSYSTNFVDLFQTSGAPVSYTGHWDVTGTLYSIIPSSPLSADNHDGRQYLLRIARPVRAFNTGVATTHEIENVSFQFNVLRRTRDALLLAQTPVFFPQVDGAGFSDYVFDYNRVYKVGQVSTHRAVDLVAHDTSVCIRWAQNSGARHTDGYRIYARNFDYRAGTWWNSTAHWTITLTGDGNAHGCANIGANNFLGADNVFSRGEQLQLIVTPVDNDGNEGAITAITAPLTISDNWSPSLTAATYNKTYVTGERDEILQSSTSGTFTLTFSEPMDLFAGVTATGVTALSGRLTAASISDVRLTSATAATGKLSLSYAIADTTTTLPAPTGQATIHVASVANLKVGDVLRIASPTTGVTETRTIGQIRSLEGAIVFTGNLTGNYPAGSTVRLAASGGLTYYLGTVTANAYKEQTSLTVTNASRFIPNQTVNIIILDESADTTEGPLTVASVSGSTVTFTSQLGFHVPSGAYITDSGATVAEVTPRAPVAGIVPQADLIWNAATASTTLANDHFTASPDTQTDKILLMNTTGFHVDDIIRVAASNVTGTTSNFTAAAGTVINSTSHGFKVGDRVRIHPPSISVPISAVMAIGATSASLTSAVTIESGESVTLTDPEFETELTVAASAGATVLSVASSTGIAPGQTIEINSGVHAAETRTVTASSSGSVTVSAGLTAAHSVGARVIRTVRTESVNATALANGATTVSIGATTHAYSLTASLSKVRNYTDHVVSAVAADTFTVTASPGPITPRGAGLRLLSADETRKITAITGKLVTLNAALSYPHRAGAAVTRPSQFAATFLTANMSTWVLGDTLICDTLPTPGDASIPQHNDRFEAILLAMNTTSGWATFSTSNSGFITTGNLSCTSMGDAVKLSGAIDSNGQPIRTTWGNKFSNTVAR